MLCGRFSIYSEGLIPLDLLGGTLVLLSPLSILAGGDGFFITLISMFSRIANYC
jgi:hypothetical protein